MSHCMAWWLSCKSRLQVIVGGNLTEVLMHVCCQEAYSGSTSANFIFTSARGVLNEVVLNFLAKVCISRCLL